MQLKENSRDLHYANFFLIYKKDFLNLELHRVLRLLYLNTIRMSVCYLRISLTNL